MKICIIGGGAAGIFAAISAKETDSTNEVIIIERNNRLGKKLLITGKGRCNITNIADTEELMNNIVHNRQFLYSALNQYSNYDTIDFFERNGLATKVERGGRVFPQSDRSIDVLNVLKHKIAELNIKVRYDSLCTKLLVQDNILKGVEINNNEVINCDKCIIATGGKSYSVTGSDGSGYTLAKSVGHNITKICGGLVPLCTKEKYIYELQGLTLKNVSIKVVDIEENKELYNDFGEMIFTHFGVSGPVILSCSSAISKYDNISEKMRKGEIKLLINLKPALSNETLDKRLQRDFEDKINKEFKNSLDELLPKRLINIVIELSKIPYDKKVNQITKEERQKLLNILQEFPSTISSFRPIEEGIITVGGIDTKEINPKTMESKIVKGLYFAGEVIDVDAYTGGYNLQIAFSTGFVSGKWQNV